MFGERGVASCDVGQIFKPPKGSTVQAPAMQTKLGTAMICDMIRPEGMSRLVGTAMRAKPDKGIICNTPEGMSRPVGTAMRTKRARA
jgi:hypothetical protein